MRETITAALKAATLAQDKKRTGTLRLISAAIKDRDIAARTGGSGQATDAELIDLLAKMVKQRLESAKIYEDNGRPELAAQEREEIAVIEEYLPKQLNEDEAKAAIAAIVTETGATGIRDMNKVMSELKARYAGQMDFAKASAAVKAALSS
ncbi:MULTISPECIES: GatB/YqeY domain-containing protein [Kaistia]|uniref:GatB/YqeY domain-containing protein n=1 Tax=Kaistia nematophila TaxID=2994654 RepID=A0A9X3IKP2_9HYPH|nr:GatB/YqeY domain-containing protein [Kaistia nematophila]MCX5569673.1 GatB/YqeY domain-containing protein [Kaistia nematophila]